MMKKSILSVLGCALLITTYGFANYNDTKIKQLTAEYTQAIAEIQEVNKLIGAIYEQFSVIYEDTNNGKFDVFVIIEDKSDAFLAFSKKQFKLLKKINEAQIKVIFLNSKRLEVKLKLVKALQEKEN